MAVQDEEAQVMQRCVWMPKKIMALSGITIRQVEPLMRLEQACSRGLLKISALDWNLAFQLICKFGLLFTRNADVVCR